MSDKIELREQEGLLGIALVEEKRFIPFASRKSAISAFTKICKDFSYCTDFHSVPLRDGTGKDMSGHNFECEDMDGRDFSGYNLRGANFRDCSLASANFSNANLVGADLRDTCIDRALFFGADLTNANLESVEASCAIFDGATLFGANLGGAGLSKAGFRGANLTGADLSESFLSEAEFVDANLTNANLTGADFRKVVLCGATVDGLVVDEGLKGVKGSSVIYKLTRDEEKAILAMRLEC